MGTGTHGPKSKSVIRPIVIGCAGMFAAGLLYVLGIATGLALASTALSEEFSVQVFAGTPTVTSAEQTIVSPTSIAALPGTNVATPSATPTLVPSTVPNVTPRPISTPRPARKSSPDPTHPDMAMFWDVWDQLNENFYYEMPSSEDRLQGAIKGMVESLDDPYTVFMPPDAAQAFRDELTRGDYVGIGITVLENPRGGVLIGTVFKNSPADRAGLQQGDLIVGVDGNDVTQEPLETVATMVRGPEGTDVTLTIQREGVEEPLQFTITRARVQIPTIEHEMKEGNIGYVHLYSFETPQAASDLTAAVQELLDQGATGLVLDLRGNGGGRVDQALAIADLFLDKGVIFIERDADGSKVPHNSVDGEAAEAIPLAVLIDEGSASASEIVAGAIQDRERGVLVGETSFGKGSEQIYMDLSDGSLLRVTFANWFTPNDRSIMGIGLTPDIEVTAPKDGAGNSDAQLDSAIQYLVTGQ